MSFLVDMRLQWILKGLHETVCTAEAHCLFYIDYCLGKFMVMMLWMNQPRAMLLVFPNEKTRLCQD